MKSSSITTTSEPELASSRPRRRRLPTRAKDCDYVIKTILLGDLDVGKTTFLQTYITGACPREGARTAKLTTASGDKTIVYHGKKVNLTLWDTAGQERYRSLTASYYRGAHACIVMYDVNNPESFDNVTGWLESVRDYNDVNTGTVTILVGSNKIVPPGPSPSPAFPFPIHRRPSLVADLYHRHTSCPSSSATLPNRRPSLAVDTPHGSSTSTFPDNHRRPSSCPAASSNHRRPQLVDLNRAESLASNYQIPHFLVDCAHDPHSVGFVMDTLVTMVMTRAVENQHLSMTIRPYSTKLHQLGAKGTNKCSGCCS